MFRTKFTNLIPNATSDDFRCLGCQTQISVFTEAKTKIARAKFGAAQVGSPKKKPAAVCMRPAAAPEQPEANFSLTSSGSHEGLPLTREAFVMKLRDWVRTTRTKPTSIKASRNDWQRSNFYYRFKCSSCKNCGWHGVAEYDVNLKQHTFKATALASHTDNARQWGSGSLSKVTKDIIRDLFQTVQGTVRLQHVMQARQSFFVNVFSMLSRYVDM